jgi:putative ABC transport system permease protein
MYNELRYILRGFKRDRRFSLSALAAIALAVGFTTAVFSVVDRSLFRPLPYLQGDRLVSVGVVAPAISTQDWLFAGTYQEWRSSQTALAALTSWSGVSACNLGVEPPERLDCGLVEATFLPTLGVAPVLGRNFTVEEDRPGAAPAALLSFNLWKSRFASDPGVVGRHISLDGTSTTIVGVLPAEYELPTLAPADLLVPQKLRQGSQNQRLISAIGRLRPGDTPESTAGALAPLFESFLNTAPPDFRKATQLRLRVTTLRDQQTRDYRLALWMLFGAVAAFVLIACANVANLMLARSASRQHEFAIRAALGASRWRLVRQALTESGILALAGGAVGCSLAACLLRVFAVLAPDGMLRLQQATLDLRVLAFASILSLGAALLCGLAPSLERLRSEAFGAARSIGRTKAWLRQSLIVAQLSISLILLTGASALLGSLWRLQHARLGFERQQIMTASFTLPLHRYPDETAQLNFFSELEERLSQLPGATAAAISDTLPPGGDPRSRPYVALRNPGADRAGQGMGGLVKWRYVTPGYFKSLGIPIARGRGFSDSDRTPGQQAVILSEALSLRLFGSGDPIGARLPLEEPMTVVGVAADVKNSGLSGASDPEFYILRNLAPNNVYRNQRPPDGWRHATAVVRSQIDEGAAAESLRAAIRRVDPTLPVVLETMDSQVERFFTRPRFLTMLLSVFAATGLALAAIGLYGLVSFLVVLRTREIGLRMAVGATLRDVMKLVVYDGMRWTGSGVVIGTVMSIGLVRLFEGLLFEIKAHDLRVFAAATMVLVFVAALAAWLPSRRAARIDPLVALRCE